MRYLPRIVLRSNSAECFESVAIFLVDDGDIERSILAGPAPETRSIKVRTKEPLEENGWVQQDLPRKEASLTL